MERPKTPMKELNAIYLTSGGGLTGERAVFERLLGNLGMWVVEWGDGVVDATVESANGNKYSREIGKEAVVADWQNWKKQIDGDGGG